LWIDGLCIVQDDEDDWLREAGHVCDVYSSSYLTIAAAGTCDNSIGISVDQHFGSRVALRLKLSRQGRLCKIQPTTGSFGTSFSFEF
ncbi:hypothetical protein K469DRAFT_578883, partial [Zopfia rhizophila CBS 207.26]